MGQRALPSLDRFFRKSLVEKLALVTARDRGAVRVARNRAAPLPAQPRQATTNLFVKDERLGWKLRPGAVDTWGDVEVRINQRGFRGPVVPYQKPRGVNARSVSRRSGDVRIPRRSLDGHSTRSSWAICWRRATPLAAETVNLAVEGYSGSGSRRWCWPTKAIAISPTWSWSASVLNDVTEMFYLARFGGPDEGFQLRHSYTSRWDRLLSRSAVVYQIQNVVREVKAKRKLGQDLRLGAVHQQALDVETLMKHPDQANVKAAWDIALADLQSIVDHCASRNVPGAGGGVPVRDPTFQPGSIVDAAAECSRRIRARARNQRPSICYRRWSSTRTRPVLPPIVCSSTRTT